MLCIAVFAAGSIRAGENQLAATSITQSSVEDTRYGIFNWLDHRSQYGLGVFPEPFLVDDTDLEVNEVRLDWLQSNVNNQTSHVIKAEIEKGFGNLTVEVEAPYEIDKSPGQTTRGFDNLSIGARYPFYQFVSAHGLVDSTFGVALEVGIPVHTTFSRNTEIVPKVFNDLKIANFTLQSLFGYSALLGGGNDGGLHTFEYGFVFGYAFQQPMRGVQQLIPILELKGETGLNKEDSGHNSLSGTAGIRVNLKALGRFQPRLGIGYVFPIDNGSRQTLRSGIITSLVFDF